MITGVIKEYPSFSIALISNSTKVCPFLIVSPCLAFNVKCFPSNFTVSIPTCINISAPLLVVIPIACPVGNSVVSIPSAGATTLPSVGIIAIPLPNAPQANASSSTFFSSVNFPFNGLEIISCLTNVFSLFCEASVLELSSSISFGSNFTNNIAKNPKTKPATIAIATP